LCWAGQFEAAARAGDTYIRHFGEDAEIHLWMGCALQAMNRIADARIHYEHAIATPNRSNHNAVILAAGFWTQVGERERAQHELTLMIANLRARLDFVPDNDRLRTALDNARALVGEARPKRPYDNAFPMTWFWYSYVMAVRGDDDESLLALGHLIDQGVRPVFSRLVPAVGALLRSPKGRLVQARADSLEQSLRARIVPLQG
jgi:hypothetical protein